MITVYTDGACIGNPGPGGWAWAVPDGRMRRWWKSEDMARYEAAASALHYVAPVGEKDEYVARAMGNIAPYLPTEAPRTNVGG